MRNRLATAIFTPLLPRHTATAAGQTASPSDDEVPFWPIARNDWPTKLSAGVLIQPPGGRTPRLRQGSGGQALDNRLRRNVSVGWGF